MLDRSSKLDDSLMNAYKSIHEVRKGHAAGDSDLEKQASQLASDIRYKAKGQIKDGMNSEDRKRIYLKLLSSSPAPGVVKSKAKRKLLGESVLINEIMPAGDTASERKANRDKVVRGGINVAKRVAKGVSGIAKREGTLSQKVTGAAIDAVKGRMGGSSSSSSSKPSTPKTEKSKPSGGYASKSERVSSFKARRDKQKAAGVSMRGENFSNWKLDLLGEEGYDRMRDKQLERGGIGAVASKSPSRPYTRSEKQPKGDTNYQKEMKAKYGGKLPSAMQVVKDKYKGSFKESAADKIIGSIRSEKVDEGKLVHGPFGPYITGQKVPKEQKETPLRDVPYEGLNGNRKSVGEEKKAKNCGCGQDPCVTYGKGDKKKGHNCASKVKHEEYGIGKCIKEMHTLDEDGNVSHYDVIFSNKIIKNVPSSSLEILEGSMHEHYVNEEKNKENYKPHKMIDPSSKKEYMADTYAQHKKYQKMGYVHEEKKGSLKQARKNVGASTCWDGYTAKGTKKKDGKVVPNCVKEDEAKYDNTKSPDYKKKKAALAKKHGGEKNIKGHPQYEQSAPSVEKVIEAIKIGKASPASPNCIIMPKKEDISDKDKTSKTTKDAVSKKHKQFFNKESKTYKGFLKEYLSTLTKAAAGQAAKGAITTTAKTVGKETVKQTGGAIVKSGGSAVAKQTGGAIVKKGGGKLVTKGGVLSKVKKGGKEIVKQGSGQLAVNKAGELTKKEPQKQGNQSKGFNLPSLKNRETTYNTNTTRNPQ